MDSKAKKFIWSILIAIQVLLIVVIGILIINFLPQKWSVQEMGKINDIADGDNQYKPSVFYYTSPLHFKNEGGSYAATDKAITEYYIGNVNFQCSNYYINNNSFEEGTEMSLEIISSSQDELIYSMSGAENDVVWETWVVFPDDSAPLYTVYMEDESK